MRWFKLQYPHKIIFAIPNGGKRGIVTASIMKAEGTLKGVPDLFIPEPNIQFHGLFIEMKYGKGKLTIEQTQMLSDLAQRGYEAKVCYSIDDFITIVNNYLNNQISTC